MVRGVGDGEDCLVVSGVPFVCASDGGERGVGEGLEGRGGYARTGGCKGMEELGGECEVEEEVGIMAENWG